MARSRTADAPSSSAASTARLASGALHGRFEEGEPLRGGAHRRLKPGRGRRAGGGRRIRPPGSSRRRSSAPPPPDSVAIAHVTVRTRRSERHGVIGSRVAEDIAGFGWCPGRYGGQFRQEAFYRRQMEQLRALGLLALTVNMTPLFEQAVKRHSEQVTSMQEVAKDLNDDAQTAAKNGTIILILGGMVAVAMGFGVGYLMARFLARGISHIANVATQAASGNLQARAKVHSQDELGQMAKAFNAMLDRITALVQTEEERDVMQKRLMQFLVLVPRSVGNLSKRGEVTADMFGNLADAFNLMIARFGQLLKQVREAAERVNKSAGTLRDSAGQMSGTARHQAEESVRTLSAVEQLALSMRQVADTAGASSNRPSRCWPQQNEETWRCKKLCATCTASGQRCNACRNRSRPSVIVLSKFHRSYLPSEISRIRPTCWPSTPRSRRPAPARPVPDSQWSPTRSENSRKAPRRPRARSQILCEGDSDGNTGCGRCNGTRNPGGGSGFGVRSKTGDVFSEISTIAQRSSELAHNIANAATERRRRIRWDERLKSLPVVRLRPKRRRIPPDSRSKTWPSCLKG